MRQLKIFLAVVALAPLMLANFASAHGPTRQKVTKTVVINAPLADVWAVVANFQDMTWHPEITKTEGSGDNAVGAKRVLTFKSGGSLPQELTRLKDSKMLFYETSAPDVKVMPVNNYSARMTVADQDGKTLVTWRAAFYRGYMNNDPPPELNDEAAVNAVTVFIEAGLAGLKAKIEGQS